MAYTWTIQSRRMNMRQTVSDVAREVEVQLLVELIASVAANRELLTQTMFYKRLV